MIKTRTFLNWALREGQITDEEYKYMVQDNPVRSVIYTLPKMHKDLQHLPGQPTVPSKESLTEPLSQYMDAHIKDFVYSLASYHQDT